jgi:hypothetical protein
VPKVVGAIRSIPKSNVASNRTTTMKGPVISAQLKRPMLRKSQVSKPIEAFVGDGWLNMPDGLGSRDSLFAAEETDTNIFLSRSRRLPSSDAYSSSLPPHGVVSDIQYDFHLQVSSQNTEFPQPKNKEKSKTFTSLKQRRTLSRPPPQVVHSSRHRSLFLNYLGDIRSKMRNTVDLLTNNSAVQCSKERDVLLAASNVPSLSSSSPYPDPYDFDMTDESSAMKHMNHRSQAKSKSDKFNTIFLKRRASL